MSVARDLAPPIEKRAQLPLLLPSNKAIEFRTGALSPDAPVIIAGPGARAYEGVRLLLGAGSPGHAAPAVARLVYEPLAGTSLSVSDAFEDAARRATRTNWWSVTQFESLVEAVEGLLDTIDGPTVAVAAASAFDIPTLRVLLTAWMRHKGTARRLILQVDGLDAEHHGDELKRRVGSWVIEELAAAVGANFTWSAGSARAHVPLQASPSKDANVIGEFLIGNDLAALERQSLAVSEGLLVEALIAARNDALDIALSRLDVIESAEGLLTDRARACSTRAVTLVRLGGPSGLESARDSVRRGLSFVQSASTSEARLETAWLLNNAALLEVLDYMRSRDKRKLTSASRLLSHALGASTGVRTAAGEALRLNATANAVRLLELEGRFGDALSLMRRAFSEPNEVAVFYRTAVLEVRVGNYAKALVDLAAATLRCPAKHWPFRLEIAHARAFAHACSGSFGAAIDSLGEGLELAHRVRSRRAVATFGSNLVRCLLEVNLREEAAAIVESLATVGLTVDDGDSAATRVSPPPSKLTPYVPEIDLAVAKVARCQINAQFDRTLNPGSAGATR